MRLGKRSKNVLLVEEEKNIAGQILKIEEPEN
jgi:hypothetical protein